MHNTSIIHKLRVNVTYRKGATDGAYECPKNKRRFAPG
jgi:hypothetical protein